MVKPVPSYLKLRVADADIVPPDVEDVAGLEPLLAAFADATGWPLRFAPGPPPDDELDLLWSAPVNPGVGVSPGHLRIDLGRAANVAELATRVPLESAEHMAAGIAGLIEQNMRLRRSLWQREAELAAGVPVTRRPDEVEHLADRLAAVLEAGTKLLGCESAALYTLDEATTQLKLRSSAGLPLDRLAQPPRALATALADLEALLGHAVVLERSEFFGPWNVPEPCSSCLCVPVSSATIPLGTLWFFCSRERDFDSQQTNLAELVAGRLASELERTVLLNEQMQTAQLQRQLDDASQMQQQALSQVAPVVDGWDIGGWTCQAAPLGGALHEWRMLPDGRLALAVADCRDGGLSGALVAASLRGALRGELERLGDPEELLRRLNKILWTASAGDAWAGVLLTLLDPRTGEIRLASAGRPTALWLGDDEPRSLVQPTLPLGLQESAALATSQRRIETGSSLLLYTRGFIEPTNEQGLPLDETSLARVLWEARTRTANELIDVLCDRQEAHALCPNRMDRSVVVIKRR